MTRLLQNPRVLITTVGLIVVAGLSAFSVIVRQEDPTITNGIAVIVSPYPGATAERVEALVTDKLEDELREISEIQTLTSMSRNGVSVVTVQIDEKILGDDTAPVFTKIRNALDDARSLYPRGVPEPIFDDERFGSYTVILGLQWQGEGPVNYGILRRYAQELQDRLRDVSGTDTVKLFGAPREQIEVRFDPEQLAGVGLTAGTVSQAIRNADAKVAAGAIRNERNNLSIELAGELDSLDRIRSIPLSVSSGAQILRVGDLATVERRTEDPPGDLARANGAPSVVVAAQLAAGVRFDTWSEDAWRSIGEFEQMLPHGISLETVFDQTVYTQARLNELAGNLATGLLLVIGILFVTMGWRSALIVTLTLPLVTLASISTLLMLGVPIHQMSVTGLIVALGLLVDNAIVVTDQIRMKRQDGQPTAAAIQSALSHLWLPLLSSTATTVLGFMPIVLLPGRVGEFVGTIGLSVIVALVSSYVFAMTITAALAGRFIQPESGPASLWTRGIHIPWLSQSFSKSLAWSLRNPKLSMSLASVLPLVGFLGAAGLPKQFFPPADRDQFSIEVRLPKQTSIAETERVTQEIDRVLRSHSEINATHWFVGRSAPPFYYNLIQSQDGAASYAQAQVRADSLVSVQRLLPILQDELDEAFPGAQILVRELLQGPPVPAPIEYRVYGAEIDILRDLGAQLRERMARVSTVTHSLATLTAGSPKLRFEADEDVARVSGLSLVDIASQLNRQLEGLPAGTVLDGTEELAVKVRVDDTTRAGMSEVQALNVLAMKPTAERGPPRSSFSGIPLSALGSSTLEPVLDGIPHRNGERVNTIRAFTKAGVFPETAFNALKEILVGDPINVPAGYRLEVGGDAEERGKAMGNLFASIPVLTLLMFAAVALSLNSFRLAGVIFAVAIQSMGLGFLSLVFFGYPLGFQALIGSIGLIGVAINAAIIINASLQSRPLSVSGDVNDIRETVIRDTSRHIVSTTITTFAGFLPLILAPGGFWPPFATAIAGGVLLSTVISFYFVPAAFLVLTRRRPVVDEATALTPTAEVPA